MSEPTYVVTGASLGIGRAVSTELASRRYRVVAVARSHDRLRDLAAQFTPYVTTVTADLATPEGVAEVAASLAGTSTIAGVVHAAGSLIALEPYDELDVEALTRHFRVHVAAPIALHRALARDHSISRMVYIDSYSASTPRPGWSGYAITKAAAQMAARSAAAELSGTHVIRVFPGAVNTRILQAVMESDTVAAKTYAALRDAGEVAEPAQAADFIVAVLADASDELLATREVWDYNNPADRAAVR